MNRIIRATDDRHQEIDQPASGSTGDGSHNHVTWNSRRPRMAKDVTEDVTEEVKEALDDQAPRLGR